ncbi:phenylacetic acid degradation protein [Thalassobius vesicularis]|uniref:Phenylacetic acid degradation protein n=1 Tax=Thalassobius vesicularis TaxID=1294297 RepID=A0A4S3MA30_9RHOB|nr:PaaX family transcriptional regulator C-terminal domain-containing protein [Thalassobius vesicularis]THD73898.1 phenylacetic acid degradation protein [Thalassobius vesicularis]
MDPLAPLISALHAEGRLRVWSLVITVFGDSVQYRGGRISNVRLQALLGRLGVEPGAIRTALSRLGRDGWLTSEREGRNSYYQLTPQGQARFTDATSRIYAAPRQDPVTRWTLAVGPGQPGLPVAPGIVLRPADQPAPTPPDCAVTGSLTELAPQLRAALLTPTHHAALTALYTDLETLRPLRLSGLDAAAARTLLIHRWRRIVLRHPEPPVELLPPDLSRQDPRTAVAAAYEALTSAAEEWLDTPIQDIAPMPKAHPLFARRFL